jgi:hypothetical protein
MEGVPRHFPQDLRLQGLQLLQNGSEVWPAVGVLCPAV